MRFDVAKGSQHLSHGRIHTFKFNTVYSSFFARDAMDVWLFVVINLSPHLFLSGD